MDLLCRFLLQFVMFLFLITIQLVSEYVDLFIHNRNCGKCKYLSTLTFLANPVMEIQMNKNIIQKKGETEKDYEGKWVLITTNWVICF